MQAELNRVAGLVAAVAASAAELSRPSTEKLNAHLVLLDYLHAAIEALDDKRRAAMFETNRRKTAIENMVR